MDGLLWLWLGLLLLLHGVVTMEWFDNCDFVTDCDACRCCHTGSSFGHARPETGILCEGGGITDIPTNLPLNASRIFHGRLKVTILKKSHIFMHYNSVLVFQYDYPYLWFLFVQLEVDLATSHHTPLILCLYTMNFCLVLYASQLSDQRIRCLQRKSVNFCEILIPN
ncbi:hypothetical protein CAPTEDRAFT_213989 [Capitella teleta]|uniref:Uncharacterized protein n=1 Tax=Capitella teleta TaxID=283909 RepID=R7TNZ5_CAPTE|nr:hypothetical protein CAPTEDRAFT_213989 [Capitella teleta]|eukprot:ELT95277.1 hypothetical protein CAPTEDRAFT_213989 [Capitella teleta]